MTITEIEKNYTFSLSAKGAEYIVYPKGSTSRDWNTETPTVVRIMMKNTTGLKLNFYPFFLSHTPTPPRRGTFEKNPPAWSSSLVDSMTNKRQRRIDSR